MSELKISEAVRCSFRWWRVLSPRLRHAGATIEVYELREAGGVRPRDAQAQLARAEPGRAAVARLSLPFPCCGAGREEIFPAARCRKADKRMSKHLIGMGFLAAGGISFRPGCDFFPVFSLPAGNFPAMLDPPSVPLIGNRA